MKEEGIPRQSRRIHKAFAQLGQSPDLWMSTDRAGFNVPELPGWLFRGPDLHWDVSLARPIPFGTQGILYLTDTEAEQGAFTLVPGFHRRIDEWLDGLPPGTDPRQQDLHALGSTPTARHVHASSSTSTCGRAHGGARFMDLISLTDRVGTQIRQPLELGSSGWEIP